MMQALTGTSRTGARADAPTPAGAGGEPRTRADARSHYGRRFYGMIEREEMPGRLEIVGRVLELVHAASVVDLGCGAGQWLAAFRASGVEDVLGIDGPWVPSDMLAIPPERFKAADLTSELRLDRRFDLAVCLEVAEHLPAARADGIVDTLVGAAPVVLFSAAVPGQGGTGHVNEQWPEHWARRFAERGYRAIDALRPAIWNDERIPPYMRQNLLLFASDLTIAASEALTAARAVTDDERLSRVHPGEFAKVTDPRQMSLRRLLGALPATAAAACRRRVGG